MFENKFIRRSTSQSIKPKGDGCKIKIKNTVKGREISFEGQCTKEQLEMAKFGIGEEDSEDKD